MLNIMIANNNKQDFTHAGNPIMYRNLESALIHSDLMYWEFFSEEPEVLPDALSKANKYRIGRRVPRSAILAKAKINRQQEYARRGYEAVTLDNLDRMAGAATYMAIRAKARGRFWKKNSFLSHVDEDGTQYYENHEWYEERIKETDPETGKRHFAKNDDGTFKKVVVRETDSYMVGSKYADNVLRQRVSSQLASGHAPRLFVREGINNNDLTIANEYDDMYQCAVLGMLEHLNANGGVDDGETFSTGGKRVGNEWKKQYTRQSTQTLVNTDENGERLPDGRFRKIRTMIDSIDVHTEDRGDSFWRSVDGRLIQADESGIDDGGIDEVARVDWMKGFLKFAITRLSKQQGACLRVLISKRDQITNVKAKNGSTRTVLGATANDINKAVYNGKASQQTVSKLKRDTQKNMLKLKKAYDAGDK